MKLYTMPCTKFSSMKNLGAFTFIHGNFIFMHEMFIPRFLFMHETLWQESQCLVPRALRGSLAIVLKTEIFMPRFFHA